MTKDNIFVALMFTLLIGFCGCSEQQNNQCYRNCEGVSCGKWMNHGESNYTKVIEIEGHKYILFDGCYKGGIIHAESCKCKKGEK